MKVVRLIQTRASNRFSLTNIGFRFGANGSRTTGMRTAILSATFASATCVSSTFVAGAFALVALMAVPIAHGAPLPVAAGGPPKIDIQRNCRLSSDALNGSTTANVYDACVADEKAAGAKLAKDWSAFPAADKARCVHAAIYLPSYVEWLTCIEGESTLRRIRKDSSSTVPRG